MNEELLQIAGRIRDLREILEIPVEELCELLQISKEEYLAYESGQRDFNFTFLYKLAKRFRVDVTDLLTGEATRLSLYTVVRAGEGLPIDRR